MGETWTMGVDDKTYKPQQISAFILQKLKRDAEAYLGEPVTNAVITVPALSLIHISEPTRPAA